MCVCMYVCMCHAEVQLRYTLIFIMIDFFCSVKKRVFVNFRTETLRTKLEPVHFRSGIESRVFFSGEKKVNHYENESKSVTVSGKSYTVQKNLHKYIYIYIYIYIYMKMRVIRLLPETCV